jgi:formylglycine-generating enzyme required for sulfatase activity
MKHLIHAFLGTVIFFFTATRVKAQQCCTGNVSTYCTAGTSVLGCLPSISGTGIPSVDAGSGFQVAVANLPGQRFGTIFYGFFSYITPWAPGSPSYKCVASPVQRTGSVNTGATAASCNGALSLDFNQWIAGNPNALGAPFLQGQTIRAQAWYRDPAAPGQTSLSDALAFTLCSGIGDTTPPVITTCASSLTLATTSGSCFVPAPDLRSQVVAVDNCSAVTIAQVPAPGAPIGLGTTPIVLRARDASQNAVTCSAVLTVVDGGAPLIASCAPNQTVRANANCQAIVPDFTSFVLALDACGGAVTITQSPPAGSLTSPGATSILVTVQVVDSTGNASYCSTYLHVSNSLNCYVSAEMALIQPGSFQMGQAGIAEPAHTVTITYPFLIGRTEVTQAAFEALMGYNPSSQAYYSSAYPVETLSWHEARAFCAAKSTQQAAVGMIPFGYEYRLPTEAEWELACRGGTTTNWSFGNSISCADASYRQTNGNYCYSQYRIVGSFSPNAFGLYDMHGNLWEWCLDSVSAYTSAPLLDPFVTGGDTRILRGGSWEDGPSASLSASRLHISPISTRVHPGACCSIGFRVVLGPILVP